VFRRGGSGVGGGGGPCGRPQVGKCSGLGNKTYRENTLLISVKVVPRSSKNSIEWEQGNLKVRLTAPPVDGAANEALVALLAERLALPKRSISIVHGATARQKMVEILGISLEDIKQKLALEY
jgi:uncharacterized protein